MNIELTVRPLMKAEQMYTYTQSAQLLGQTGCIGHLRADMDSDGRGFFSTWNEHRGYLGTDQFRDEFNEVIRRLRFGPEDENSVRFPDGETFLANRSELGIYCRSRPYARMQTESEYYGFRADTEKYSYLMRVNPNKGEYNLYCYCYRRDWLDQHLKNAARGIRFIDSNYNTLFRLPDGGSIRITWPDGEVRTEQCRYIDEYHVEIGRDRNSIYHICEFAEITEKNGAAVKPLDRMQELTVSTQSRGRAR